MKKILCSLVSLLFATSAYAQTVVLTDNEKGIEKGNVTLSNKDFSIKTPFTIEQKVLHGGKQEGSKVLVITSKDGLAITLSPTRGMGILNVKGYGVHLGWQSPVKDVVNPAYINLDSRSGLGWLEGFNEMMVRCGYESAGHPVTSNGETFNLHGKAANTPASYVEVEVSNKAPYEIKVRGLLKETSFKKVDLQTMTELTYVPGTDTFSIHDVLTNHGDYDHEYEIIYHSNFGLPLLEEGARVIMPAKTISPFNDYAKAGLKNWKVYQGQTRDFDEMLYNFTLFANQDHTTEAALVNKAGDKGVSIQFNVEQLPYLGLWKNTDTAKQGYVTGIEPGTNYAYPVTVEREQHRVKTLQAGASTHFDLTYTLIHDKAQANAVEKRVTDIQGDRTTEVSEQPLATYLYKAGPKGGN